MAETNLYEELKDALQEFKDFLHPIVDQIRDAIQALASMIPGITDIIDLLIDLMNQIKAEIEKLDVNAIPGLSDVVNFTARITGFLDASADLLPDGSEGTVADIRSAMNVVGSLPSLEQLKQEILDLIDFLVTDLTSLKPA